MLGCVVSRQVSGEARALCAEGERLERVDGAEWHVEMSAMRLGRLLGGSEALLWSLYPDNQQPVTGL